MEKNYNPNTLFQYGSALSIGFLILAFLSYFNNVNAADVWFVPGHQEKYATAELTCILHQPNVNKRLYEIRFQSENARYCQYEFYNFNGIPGWSLGHDLWILRESGFPCPSGYVDDNTGQCIVNKQPIEQCKMVGNPIAISNGNKHQVENDYQSNIPFGLDLVRRYNSIVNANTLTIGQKWTHNFAKRVVVNWTNALLYKSTGQVFEFNYNGTDWIGDVDIPDRLEEVLDVNGDRTGWVYTDSSDNVETYNAEGQLLTITNRAGQSQTLVYDLTVAQGGDDNPGTLDKVRSYNGEELIFTYDSYERISTMTDPEGHLYHYSYDGIGNLVSVTYPDDTPSDLTNNPTRTYHYENTAFPHHLTGLTDETGSRVTWAYDTEGRAISSELDGGVDKFTLDYTVADQATVTNPLGKDTTYHFTTLHGVKKVTQVEGHPTASCAGANQNYTYDLNGYMASKTDWQGNVTTYVHDARGLETSRTEASGTAQARTITTTWHPDFRLPLTITELGKVTTYTYDGQGRQVSKTVRD